MAVSVHGVGYDNQDGLQAALNSTFKANADNGAALLNAHEAAEQRKRGDVNVTRLTAPRPAYVRQEWPKHVYHADGRDQQVANAEELAIVQELGYRLEPYRAVKVAVLDPAVEKAKLEAALREKDGKIATLADSLATLQGQVALLLKKASKPGKPGKQGSAEDE